ncbi:hypothetical protein [Aquirufa rosea]|uniref:Uncharacterized protein n=1 Tax=Aquirufa rosea TaxID=2509241 RepID=A0A4Q1C299_9BACT|nr:hypothetical protein [Aquirufa rosea]RXK52297.1 hypothetical protein ESB04_01215 [Aquirufa rosea]
MVIFLFSVLAGIIYYIQVEEENQPSTVSLDDVDLVQRYEDSLKYNLKEVDVDREKENDNHWISRIEDFEARAELKNQHVYLSILKGSQTIFYKVFKATSVRQILSTDLNRNMHPEFWFLFFQGKSSQILVYEYFQGQIKTIEFPQLKGRQKFGYAGNDSLHVDKSYIVRSFDFRNDSFADFPNGIRACYYSLGLDRSFVLNKTLDLEDLKQ